MRIFFTLTLFSLVLFLSSCEMSCSVGSSDKEVKGKAEQKDGASIYNGIKLTTFGVKLKRAYLLFNDGTRVPDDNFVDFEQPVKLILEIDTGWVATNDRVFLGVSEKIVAEDGRVIAETADLFTKFPEGISVADSKFIYPIATITHPKNIPPTSYAVQIRVWDKNGTGYIEGSYMLFSK